jgi:hypothetical protein
MRPARRAVEDPRLQGVKSHFDSAQSELALGTPDSLRKSVHESACAVEGAMKVLLTQRGEHSAAVRIHREKGACSAPSSAQLCGLRGAAPQLSGLPRDRSLTDNRIRGSGLDAGLRSRDQTGTKPQIGG